MKPIRLLIQAFGPYAGQQVIDFRELKGRTLFLIHGPIGSGKSTILDAICFALYGQTSAGIRDVRDMRSHFAPPELPLMVVFDFSIGDEIYRIERSPEQERPKFKGTGTTTQPPRATLWRRTGLDNGAAEGDVLRAKWSEVTEEVERLLGFRVEEFRQVVMLPQGRFQEFLLAGSTERQRILETLFQTGFYRRIEEALKARASEIENEVNTLRTMEHGILEQTATASLAELQVQRASLISRQTEAQRRQRELTSQEKVTQDRLNKAREQALRFAELDAAAQASANLETERESNAARRSSLDSARKAADLRDAEQIVRERRGELASATQKRKQAAIDLAAAEKNKHSSEVALQHETIREPERGAARSELERLKGLQAKVSRLDAVRTELVEAKKRFDAVSLEYDDVKSALDEHRRDLKTTHKQLESAKTTAAELRSHQSDAKRFRIAHKVAEDLAKWRRDKGKADNELTAVRKTRDNVQISLNQGEKELKTLMTKWVKGQAARLAKELEIGKPCPVCGSTRHPAPACSRTEIPIDEEIETAREDVKRLQSELDAAQGAVRLEERDASILVQKIANSLEQLGEMEKVSATELQRQLRAAEKQVELAQRAKDSIDKLAKNIEEAEKREVALNGHFDKLEKRKTQATEERVRAEATVQELEADIPKNLRATGALASSIATIADTLGILERALTGAREADSTAGAAVAAAQQGLKALTETEGSARRRAQDAEEKFAERLHAAG
ncbi:MAG: AAA family ATPase, partial [Burkholderiales bacterium]